MPDNILYYILSILTRKDACKTSILSRRWRSLPHGLHSAPMYDVPYEDNCSRLTLGCCNLIQYHIDFNKLKGLVTLILDVVIIDEAVMASMLSTCTLLEGLTLDACNVVSNLIVTGPPSLRLKKLKVRYCSTKKIEISAANLIAFDFSGDITRISSFSAPRLLKVHFNTGTKASTFAHGLAQFASHPCLENLSLIMYSSTVSAYNFMSHYSNFLLRMIKLLYIIFNPLLPLFRWKKYPKAYHYSRISKNWTWMSGTQVVAQRRMNSCGFYLFSRLLHFCRNLKLRLVMKFYVCER